MRAALLLISAGLFAAMAFAAWEISGGCAARVKARCENDGDAAVIAIFRWAGLIFGAIAILCARVA